MIDNSYGSRQTTRPTATETAPETPRKHATNAGNSAPKITELTERTTKSATARVQLRLTHGMVRILKAFKGAGTHPSQIVETALWRDGRIKDAATLLRVPETGESN